MIDSIVNWIGKRPNKKQKQHSSHRGSSSESISNAKPRSQDRRQTFTKVFRWPVPAGSSPQPTEVEVLGSFNDWQRVPLVFEKTTRTWHTTLRDVEGNRTHHYVFLVDGKPSYDQTCDGLTIPQGPQEIRWQIDTSKGPRVMLLFGQAK